MNTTDKKLIIFDDGNNKILGEKRFIKFLDEGQNHAIFYMPLVAPKYFENYLKENNILKAYEVVDEKVLIDYHDRIYTFLSNHGIYDVSKGIEAENKLVLLVDKGMDINVDLPIYSYTIKNNCIYVKPLKEKPIKKDYCYVANQEYVNQDLRKIMIPVIEAIPGILCMGNYPFDYSLKTKRYKLK